MFIKEEYYAFKKEEGFASCLSHVLKKEPVGNKIIRYFRMSQFIKNKIIKRIFERFYYSYIDKYGIELHPNTKIGKGLYLGHPFGITVNPRAVLGEHVCLHKGVTIGMENRGINKGAPVIGNCVWIGINSMIFGNIKIGDDVLISPNSVVNFSVPSHSVVFGNPAVIKSKYNAVDGYISKKTFMKYFGETNEKDIDC